MPFLSPLPSGLSLFVHLGVIFIAWMLGLLGFTRKHTRAHRGDIHSNKEFARSVGIQVVSMLILILMGAAMMSFTIVALQTGYREGKDEPHRVLIRQTAENAGNAFTKVPGMLSLEAEYSRGASQLETTITSTNQ